MWTGVREGVLALACALSIAAASAASTTAEIGPATTARRPHAIEPEVRPVAGRDRQQPTEVESQVPDRLAWWRDARFGLFIHWGLYSIPGGIWQGKPVTDFRFANPYAEHVMWLARVPLKEYQTLAAKFDPVRWDARAIVAAARAAGMRYVVFTAKHHDGFAMYHSEVSDYNVYDATPWHRDPLRELADACREADLKLGIYYSLGRDWSDPDAVAEGDENIWDFPVEGRDAQRYLDRKVIPQITELLSNYGPIAVVWFDTPEQTTLRQSLALEELVRRLQPEAVVNTRLGNGVGDYEERGDNEVPAHGTGRDFEVPGTMAESWGYSRLDTPPYWKSSTRLIRTLVDIASKGGNYLLNIGPDGTGAVPQLAKERLSAIAQWMQRYGESIHDTRSSSLRVPAWGRFMQRGDTVYAHVFDWPRAGQPLIVPIASQFVQRIEILGGDGEALSFEPTHGAGVLVSLPAAAPDPHVSVLRIRLR